MNNSQVDSCLASGCLFWVLSTKTTDYAEKRKKKWRIRGGSGATGGGKDVPTQAPREPRAVIDAVIDPVHPASRESLQNRALIAGSRSTESLGRGPKRVRCRANGTMADPVFGMLSSLARSGQV